MKIKRIVWLKRISATIKGQNYFGTEIYDNCQSIVFKKAARDINDEFQGEPHCYIITLKNGNLIKVFKVDYIEYEND